MAELVDALASGASDRMVVEVQVLFWAPLDIMLPPFHDVTMVQRQVSSKGYGSEFVFAQVAELVDALASGASDRMVVEVQVLFWAPNHFMLSPFHEVVRCSGKQEVDVKAVSLYSPRWRNW